MCVRDDFNDIWQNGSWSNINTFMDYCAEYCHKFGSCDYYGYLSDKLKELEGGYDD